MDVRAGDRYDGEFREGQELLSSHTPTTPRCVPKQALAHACARAGDRYDGEFREGQEDGIGIFTWADGATYNGFWAGGAKQGVGVYRPAGSPENKRATTPLERHTTQPAGFSFPL
jgi:hypothetical protein